MSYAAKINGSSTVRPWEEKVPIAGRSGRHRLSGFGWLLLFLLAGIGRTLGQVGTLDDLEFWVGTGPNRAALVIDWDDAGAQPPLAWGFRWSGTATGESMFRSVVSADVRLYARMGTPGPFGPPLFGIGYDRNGDGFGLSDGTVFTQGVAVTAPSDGVTSSDPGDSYNEGWNTGFWAYFGSQGSPYVGGVWQSASLGFSDRVLADGDWDGFSFAPGFVGPAPDVPMAAVSMPHGDFNRDGLWNCADVDALVAEIVAQTHQGAYDLTGDGLVSRPDLAAWLVVGGDKNMSVTGGEPFLPGDADLDGSVDGTDFGRWNAHAFTAAPAWCSGDFDASGQVDGSDIGIWNAHKFQSSSVAASPVPEATTWAWLTGLAALGWRRARRQRTDRFHRIPGRKRAESAVWTQPASLRRT